MTAQVVRIPIRGPLSGLACHLPVFEREREKGCGEREAGAPVGGNDVWTEPPRRGVEHPGRDDLGEAAVVGEEPDCDRGRCGDRDADG